MNGGPLAVDTFALLAVLFAEKDARLYAQTLESAAGLGMTAPNWGESMQAVTARRGDMGLAGLDELLTGLEVEIVPCNAAMARLA